jgi:hypothetical protein
MRMVVLLLAVAGFAAVALRAASALLDVLRGGAESFLAGDLAGIRARRGDLSGLQEATELRKVARQRRMVALGAFAMWAVLLMVPPLTPWPELLYAAYSLLWLAPRRIGRKQRA